MDGAGTERHTRDLTGGKIKIKIKLNEIKIETEMSKPTKTEIDRSGKIDFLNLRRIGRACH